MGNFHGYVKLPEGTICCLPPIGWVFMGTLNQPTSGKRTPKHNAINRPQYHQKLAV